MYWYVVVEHMKTREIDNEVIDCHPFERYHHNSDLVIIYMREINETEYKMFKGTLQ